jgi:hypothetical protein
VKNRFHSRLLEKQTCDWEVWCTAHITSILCGSFLVRTELVIRASMQRNVVALSDKHRTHCRKSFLYSNSRDGESLGSIPAVRLKCYTVGLQCIQELVTQAKDGRRAGRAITTRDVSSHGAFYLFCFCFIAKLPCIAPGCLDGCFGRYRWSETFQVLLVAMSRAGSSSFLYKMLSEE